MENWLDEAYRDKSTNIDESDLNSEILKVSADLAYWGQKLADIDKLYEKCRIDRNTTRAILVLTTKKELEDQGKKVTDKIIEAYVDTSPEYRVARDKELEAKYRRDTIYSILDAVKAKKDMLQTKSANLRAERRGLE